MQHSIQGLFADLCSSCPDHAWEKGCSFIIHLVACILPKLDWHDTHTNTPIFLLKYIYFFSKFFREIICGGKGEY